MNDQRQTLIRRLRLYAELCNCAGPQPSLNSARADEHDVECSYRARVTTDDTNQTDEKGSKRDD